MVGKENSQMTNLNNGAQATFYVPFAPFGLPPFSPFFVPCALLLAVSPHFERSPILDDYLFVSFSTPNVVPLLLLAIVKMESV
jgi:hypothetical protein